MGPAIQLGNKGQVRYCFPEIITINRKGVRLELGCNNPISIVDREGRAEARVSLCSPYRPKVHAVPAPASSMLGHQESMTAKGQLLPTQNVFVVVNKIVGFRTLLDTVLAQKVKPPAHCLKNWDMDLNRELAV